MSIHGNRPAYLDKLFLEHLPFTSSVSSLDANLALKNFPSLSSELHANEEIPPKLSPGFDRDSFDDSFSVRSLRLHLSPRFKMRKLFGKRTHSRIQETVEFDCPTSPSQTWQKHSSPPRPQTAWGLSPTKPSQSKVIPSPCPSPVKVAHLHYTPCYYANARNCHGYVLGSGHGDACENCAASGFFGAP